MSSLLGKKIWRLNDVVRVIDNERVVQMFKFTHPFRSQEITVIPTPRYASKSFYESWVYQPYAQEHCLCFSNDLYAILNVALFRFLSCFHSSKQWLLQNNKPMEETDENMIEEKTNERDINNKNIHVKDQGSNVDNKLNDNKNIDDNNKVNDGMLTYEYFKFTNLPDNIDLNVTRRNFKKRIKQIKVPTLLYILTSTQWRDKHAWTIERKISNVVSNSVLSPIQAEDESIVFLLQPRYAVVALNALQKSGFVLTDSVYAEAGTESILKRLDRLGLFSEYLILSYMWLLNLLVMYDMLRRVNDLYIQFNREKAEEFTRLASINERN